MATPEEIARKEEERLLKAFERSAKGQAGKPAPVVKPKIIAEAPKPKPNPRPTSTPTNSGSIPTRPPTSTTVSKPAPSVQDKPPLSATLSSGNMTTSPRTVESAAIPVERPPKKKKDPAEKAAKKEWRMKNKKWTIDDLMRVSEEALQGKHKAPHQGSHDESNEDWKRGAETVDNLLQQRQAKEHEQEAFAKAQKEAKEKKKKDESPRDPLKEQEELEKLLSLSFLPVEEEPYTPPSYHKESSHREAEKVKDTTKELDELDRLMNIPLPEVPSYTPTTSYESKSSSTSSFSTYSAPPPKTYEPSKAPSSARDLDNLSADLSELDNLIHSFQNEAGSIAQERQQQQREAEERKRKERERELEEQRRREDAKRRAAEEKQQSLKQWEEERNKVKAAEELLRQRNEAEKVAQSQAIESQANGKKEVAAAGKILIQTLDDFEQGNYARDRAVAFVSAIQKINDSVPLVFPPLRSDDVARNIVESTMKELIAMGTEMVILIKKNPVSELDRAEILALRLAIRGRLAVVLKEVQKATEVVAVVYDEKKIDELLSFKSTPVVTPSASSSSVGLSLVDFKRKAAALGHKAGQVLEKQDLNVPELSEVLTQIEATFPEFTDLGPVLTDQHAKKRYTEASLHVNSLGRKMLRDPLDFPVRMQLVQAVLAWLQALGQLA